MSNTSAPLTFIVPGSELPAETPRRGVLARGRDATSATASPLPDGLPLGKVKHAIRIGAQRGGGAKARVTATPGEDVVVLHLVNGPALVLHPETARDLMMAQGRVSRSRAVAEGREAGPGEVEIPVELTWDGLQQGVGTRGARRASLGSVAIAAFEILTGVAKDRATKFAASGVVKAMDGQVVEGVYPLNADHLSRLKDAGKPLRTLPAPPDGGPLLVLIHGTFTETSGTFGKFWANHSPRVRALFQHYQNQVYALDHETLGRSPIANALTLARSLPAHSRVHLLTHSRGGLVAEVLARIAADPDLSHHSLAGFNSEQRAEIEELASLAKRKRFRVERIVRVACPARGTLLASNRLDAYVSVFKWTLELAGVPVVPQLVDFLGEVAQRRKDDALLPGLAAQVPDSALIQWLHDVDHPIEGDLRVVAGDMEGDSVTTWLKTLLSDAFYWTDNDLVVQTRAMYGGAPRARGASFVLDQGGNVSHFKYFSNERTAAAIVRALIENSPEGFRVIGPLSWAGESATGVRAARRGGTDGRPAARKPAVFLLPGILGSNLKINGDRVWLGWRIVNGLKRLEYDPRRPSQVLPDGPVGMIYDDLAEFLAETHEVIEFAYDWRVPIEEEARRLSSAIDAALTARNESKEPVRIIAHSMGGVLARTMQLEKPEVWDRMMQRAGARMLMLGTPNGGSWAPMQVLSSDDNFGNLLVNFGAPFQDESARRMLAKLPGFLQLQASLLDPQLGLARHATWQTLADQDIERLKERSWWHRLKIQLDVYNWGVPTQEVLDQAVALRQRLDSQARNELGRYADKLLLVVGKAKFTPDGYKIGEEGLVYLNAEDYGDGRVTLASALLPGVRTWTFDCDHGKLPDKKAAFPAYLDLLERGQTDKLPVLSPSARTRGSDAADIRHVPSRPSRDRLVAPPPPESTRELLTVEEAPGERPEPSRNPPLRITVINGNLQFVREPLMLGHYRAMSLAGAESTVNQLIGKSMEAALNSGLYPEAPGTHQIFTNNTPNPQNPLQLPRPESVVVVGLGSEGQLTSSDITFTVRQAVIAWSQRLVERPDAPPLFFQIAATLIGSGGTGVTVEQSAQAIARGVREANERLVECQWPRVDHLNLIELFLDRATDAWRALQIQAMASPDHFQLTQQVQTGVGGLPRPLESGYRGASYDYISAHAASDDCNDQAIQYTIDTKRARSEEHEQPLQGRLVEQLVETASNDAVMDSEIGRTLFRLLVPVEMEPLLGSTSDMVLEVDRGTAGIPWEMLDTDSKGGGDPRPWAIRAKLLRKLKTAEFRQVVVDASLEASALVIGEPQCDPTLYPPLPGARAEARSVADLLGSDRALGRLNVTGLISDDTTGVGADNRTVLRELLRRPWRIVHIAGHGEPPEKIGPIPAKRGDPPQSDGDPRGVVLSDETFLGPREIRNMRAVPELVFVNCCHLAARNPGQLLRAEKSNRRVNYDRARFAAGVAEELIKLGVRCVIAAGWAVQDDAAQAFATTFYRALLRKQRFMDAVAEARAAAHAFEGNTWAAYQCYGDPDWKLNCQCESGSDVTVPSPKRTSSEFIPSPQSLILQLQTLEVKSRFNVSDRATAPATLKDLEKRYVDRWGGLGAVAEAFGAAWAAAGDRSQAMDWYRRALQANDGGASLKAAEQLGNLQVRQAWQKLEAKLQARNKLPDRSASPRSAAQKAEDSRGAKDVKALKAQLQEAEDALRAQANATRKTLRQGVALLENVVTLEPSMERLSLLGSASKRLAMLEGALGQTRAELAALQQMKKQYARAEEVGQAAGLPDRFYPALNRMAADLALNGGRKGWKGFDDTDVAEVEESLQAKIRTDVDFWSVAGVTELRFYRAISHGTLASALGGIQAEYKDLHARVPDVGMWGSVRDQAQFVLSRYLARASAAERKAAQALLEHLETLASAKTKP